jgi:predicted TIM-barrel fold metal-dependent hydrolase
VDVHWHPDHWNLGEPALGAAEQLAVLDRFGCERVIISAIRALCDDLEAGNALTAHWTGTDPRIHGLIVVNPLHQQASLGEIARYADHPRFVGIKTIQDVYGMGLDDEAYEPLLRAAEARGLPVVAHLPGMDRAAQRHPGVQFMATHGNWGRTRRHAPLPNIAFEISTGHALRQEGQLRRFIDEVGADRVVYGSDGQLVSPAWTLAKVDHAALPADTLERVLRTNAYRLFPKLRNPPQ